MLFLFFFSMFLILFSLFLISFSCLFLRVIYLTRLKKKIKIKIGATGNSLLFSISNVNEFQNYLHHINQLQRPH